MQNTPKIKDNITKKKCAVKNFFNKIGLKKVIITTILIIVFIGFIPATTKINLSSSDPSKWVVVNKEYTHENIVLGEYGAYIQKNYKYIQQNPFLLMSFLNNLINQHVSFLIFANEALKLNLAVSKDTILEIVSQIPAFQNDKQEFDAQRFKNQIVSLYGMEDIFLYDTKINMLKDQLLNPIYSSIQQPEYLTYLDYLAITQKRDVSYIEIDPSKIKITKKPTDEELNKLKEQHKLDFTIPEKRSFTVLTVNSDTLQSITKASDQDVEDFYNAHKSDYLEEEKRSVYQVLFPSEKDAKDFLQRMSNLSGQEIIKQFKIETKFKMNYLGNVQYKDFPNEISSIIFNVEQNKLSKPVKSALGWHIFLVDDIIANNPKSLESVYNDISLELSANKKQEKIEEYKNLFINMTNQNKSMDEIAKYFNGNVKNYKSINALDTQIDSSLLKDIFKAELTQTPILQNDTQGNLVAYKVNKIEKERLQDLNEIRPQVTELWYADELKNEVNTQSNNMVAKLLSGTKIGKLNKKVSKATLSMLSSKEDQIFSDIGIKQLYSVKRNQPAIVNLKNGNTAVVIVDKITNSKINYLNKDGSKNQEVAGFASYANQSYGQELLQSMSINLSKKYKVFVNEKAILNKLAPQDSENNK